jgi:putative transposase
LATCRVRRGRVAERDDNTCTPSYAGHWFPAEILSHAIWLYFRFPLSLCMIEEMLAVRGIIVSHQTVRQWARKFGQDFANRIQRRLPGAGDNSRQVLGYII